MMSQTAPLQPSNEPKPLENSKEKNEPLNVVSEINYLKRLRRDFKCKYKTETDPRIKQGWGRLILSSSALLHELRGWRLEERVELLEEKIILAYSQKQQEEI